MGRDDKAMLKLAEAMSKLADRLADFQDPVLWQKVIQDALRTGALPAQVAEAAALPPVRIEAVTVSLSDEEREKLAAQVHEAVQPQLAEFNEFVKESLKEIPPARLKELAEKIEAGAKPQLRRRRGCIFLELDSGEEFYLGL